MFILIETVTKNYVVVDKKRDKIISISEGKFEDITEKCKKIYLKENIKDNKKMGTIWYEILKNKISNYDHILKTDDQKDFDLEILEIVKKQLELKIKGINYNIGKLKNNTQYYTYELSNI